MAHIHGIHHVTAVTAQASKNKQFYTEVLGLRLVKKTVNQDDTSAYHLFYADAVGSPGTDMTFFDWEQASGKREGNDEISRTYFRVPSNNALGYWKKRLSELSIPVEECVINNHEALLFEDPEGQRLGLINDNNALFEGEVWDKAGIDKEYALRGFYAVELSIPDLDALEPVLIDCLGWEKQSEYIHPITQESVYVYAMDRGGPGKEVHVRVHFASVMYASYAGGVHHVAFRVTDEQEMLKWVYHLEQFGIANSGIVERFYFKSLYFRISRGILFEIATDGPGFSADEPIENLGEKLSLPPFLEPDRQDIEAHLKPL